MQHSRAVWSVVRPRVRYARGNSVAIILVEFRVSLRVQTFKTRQSSLIVPTPPDCHNTSGICLNSGVVCTATLGNAQCAPATLS